MQVGLSTGAVLLFIAGSVYVSTMYGTNGDLSPEGGVAIVATIAGFILLMLIAGLWIERREF